MRTLNPREIPEGTDIQGYRIVRKVAEGPLRVAYEAEHAMLGRRAAIKFAAAEEWREAFLAAARMMSKLQYPGITTLYDAGTYDGIPFIATEWIEGINFGQQYMMEGKIDLATSLRIFVDVATALDHAHTRGVLHRNVKPKGVIITKAGRAVLTDFELAVPIDDEPPRKVAGTPPYMAPEQWRKEPLTCATDIWGMGALMYSALSRRHLGDLRPDSERAIGSVFEGLEHEFFKDFTLSNNAVDFSYLGTDVPPYVISIIKKCLHREPKERWHTIGHLKTALESAVSQMQIDSTATTVAYTLPDVGDTIVVYAESHEDEVSGDYRQFELTHYLGSGGFGTVFRAHDAFAERDVALKFLKPEHLSDENTVTRFHRESKFLSQLLHPNVVRIYSQGRYGPTWFIALQLLEPQSVASLLGQHGPFEIAQALAAFQQIVAGLAKLHRHGIVHRDIKPANIGILDGRYVISDLGFARSTELTKVTASGAIIGTLHYMAPEQAVGTEGTAAADMYSMGAVFYEMLTGETPHRASSIGQLVHAIRNESIPPIGEVRQNVPDDIADMIGCLLAKDPAERPTAAECLSVLSGF